MIEQIFRRLQLLFSVGKAILVGRDTVQATSFEDDPIRATWVEPYGFSYFPPNGGQPHLLFLNGDRAHGFCIIYGHRTYKMSLAQGEVALHDDVGNYLHIKRGGIVEVKASAKVLADTPLFETTQNAKIGGDLVVAGKTQSNAGYFGDGGGAAKMSGGADITGDLTVNGVSMDENHGHTNNGAGPVIR